MASVKKAIKIYARLKPSESAICKYEIDKHVNDDGSTDDILVLSSSLGEDYSSNSSQRPETYKFRYSKVFDGNSGQDEIFDEICQPVLDSAVQGYNGSGKTFTMTGSRQQWNNRGIIPRSLSYIFSKFNELTDRGFIASAFLSYLEIYNENGYDLLHSGFSSGRIEDLKKVQLLEDAQQQIHMRNLTVHPIKSEDEAMQLLYLGDHNRIIAETPMNEASTRSHCIFTIHLNIREGDSSTVRRSKVHLVDLAGSERLANSNSTGQLFHEARHINLALHYLEQVIVALGEAHRSHIPYRNSMMTSILRDSLGGNCMTSMIATLSLEHRNIMESLSTCRFSQRVALVTNAAILNEETDPMLLIAQLKAENKRLKEIIANSSIKQMELNPNPLTQEEVAECWRLVEKFVTDSDDEAILPIPPDMKMVQTCFRCLKMATQMSKEDILGVAVEGGIPLSAGSPSRLLLPSTVISRPDVSQYSEEMSREQLLECLRIRDAEIDVLTKMLRPARKNCSSRFANNTSINSFPHPTSSKYEHGDGPTQLSSPSRHKGEGGGTRARRDGEDIRFPSGYESEYDGGGALDEEDGGGAGYQKMTIDHRKNQFQNEHASSPVCSGRGDFDSESLFIEGLSESKKQALDAFIRSYKGREKLENARDSLLAKRNEVESIESLLRRNHANLKNLKLVMMNSEGAAEDEDVFIRDAVESQSKSVEKQERQLYKSREEMRQIEESLKGLYAQLMSDFEKQWACMKGSGGGIDQSIVEEESKPLSEVTKGIVKGVGGNSPRSRRYNSNDTLPRNNSFNAANSSPSKSYYLNPTSPSTSKRSSSARRKHSARSHLGSSRGSNLRSPRSNTQDHPRSLNNSKGSRVPPGTPTRVPPPNMIHQSPSGTLEIFHRHPDFTSPSRDSFYEVDVIGNLGEDCDDERDEEDLIKDLPMTGDETIDQEILAFFRTRQAVFKKINGDNKQSRAGSSSSSNNQNHSNQSPHHPPPILGEGRSSSNSNMDLRQF